MSKNFNASSIAFILFMFFIFGIGYYAGVESQKSHPERPPYKAFIEER